MFSRVGIEQNIVRFDFFIKTLKELIENIEPNYINNNHWWTFGIKFAKKFLIQATTLRALYSINITFENDSNEERIVDFSSLYALLRTHFEAYAVYCHLFVRCEDIEENIIRFRLWEIHSYKMRQNHYKFKEEIYREKLEGENDYINKQENFIRTLSYYQKLPINRQNFLLKNTAWRFTTESLKHDDKRKWNKSISSVLLDSDIDDTFIKDVYHEFSNHIHPSIMGLYEYESAKEQDKINHEYIATMHSNMIICFFIDKTRKFNDNGYYASLSEMNREVIESFITPFRKGQKS